ncbi:MAG: penicillin-insensitive murein endopeptidase [Magnetospirillum sp.]|nr:penicillin-insensitive murein endopeptidase [Magnetospirillum sp.]
MRGRMAGAVVLMLAAGTAAGAGSADPWADIRVPASGRPEAIGSPAAGCLAGAVALPPDGDGYQAIRLERNRFYGHPDTIAFIRRLGRKAKGAGLGILLIGDMAQPRGGPMSFGHGSHQTGLDVDIWFRMAQRPLTAAERAEPQPVSMVAGRHVDPSRWSGAQVRLLRLAAETPEVDRIFVNPAIKAELCGSVTGDRAWLRKIRPWWGHDEHFHVRLACPKDDPACAAQAPVPEGDGCGAELAWWSVRGMVPGPSDRPDHRHPRLPAACAGILKQAAAAARSP